MNKFYIIGGVVLLAFVVFGYFVFKKSNGSIQTANSVILPTLLPILSTTSPLTPTVSPTIGITPTLIIVPSIVIMLVTPTPIPTVILTPTPAATSTPQTTIPTVTSSSTH